jgi:hypothetical protein
MQAAAAVPAEEHPYSHHHDGCNPCDHSAIAAHVLCTHMEETTVVSGSFHLPFSQELTGVWTNLIPGVSCRFRMLK